MPSSTPLPLILNSFTLALAVSFLLIVLWYDTRRTINQLFALFLVSVQIWSMGFLFQFLVEEVTLLPSQFNEFPIAAFVLFHVGYAASAISLYTLAAALVGVQPRRVRLFTLGYLSIAIIYVVALVVSNETGDDRIQVRTFTLFFFGVFNSLAIYVTWRYRHKLGNIGVMAGVVFFVVGQAIHFLSADLSIAPYATTVSSIGAIIISFSIVRRELIKPLVDRGAQLEAMHEVSLAITSRIATDAVLGEITERAAKWLSADAAGCFLIHDNSLQLGAAYNLPDAVLQNRLALGQGVAGTVAKTKTSLYLENYRRDWHGEPDLPLADETFGSVICVPLIYDQNVIGVLMVIAGLHGHLFDQADVLLLEKLASQAAVAIAYGDLFTEQRHLTEQLAIAHEQLKTVLVGTESPVIAVDRNLRLIFTNPAAISLFALTEDRIGQLIVDLVPRHALPTSYLAVLRGIRENRTFVYEIELEQKTFFCQVASLGEGRIEGWVAVLNDVTKLMELDRIKNEMIRMTSHDLKNPLQAAMANLELLRDDLDDVHDPEVMLSLENIDTQLGRMYRIISGILQLERVRMGANALEVCYPQRMIRHAVDEMMDTANTWQVALILDVSPDTRPFLADPEQIESAFINLIENAIKFNHPGGEVRISAKNDDQHILITVQDNGIGIPDEVQSKIFDRFYRAHQPGAEHISGTGLGLSLVKTVIESHNGKLWVESQMNVGSCFYIHLPSMMATPQPELS